MQKKNTTEPTVTIMFLKIIFFVLYVIIIIHRTLMCDAIDFQEKLKAVKS